MTDEEVVMRLIVPAGNAKSDAIRAISAARSGDFDEAERLLAAADEAILEAHELQSEQIRAMINGEDDGPVSLVMVHGQDHLMNAITTMDLARQVIGLAKELSERIDAKA